VIIIRTPERAARNKISAQRSKIFSLLILSVLIDANENIHENVRRPAIIEANSSIRVFCVFSAI